MVATLVETSVFRVLAVPETIETLDSCCVLIMLILELEGPSHKGAGVDTDVSREIDGGRVERALVVAIKGCGLIHGPLSQRGGRYRGSV